MLIIFGFLFSGVLAGYLLRRFRVRWMGKVTTALIWLLLFLLGVEVGCNEELVRGLPTLGAEAALIAVVCVMGSCLTAMLLWRWVRGKEKPEDSAVGQRAEVEAGADAKVAKNGALRDGLIIVVFFAAGILLGISGTLPFDIADVNLAMPALYALILSVGFSIGNNPDILGSFRRLRPGLALLPLCTVVGTLAASALTGLVLPHRSVPEAMAVGSGFAYYSLSSVIITEYKGAELGTVALIANIVREFITLLAAPLLARWFGKLAPIASGGATTADVTLPVITRACGEQYAVLSIYHGFLVDFSVPFLVTFFCLL